jgi:ubiquinol-cytochrome c reductase cytochrome b subunit
LLNRFERLLFFLTHSVRTDVLKFGVGNVKLAHGLALVLMSLFILQLLSGVFLVSLCTFVLDRSLDRLAELFSECWYVWLVRDLHMLGANSTLILLYFHLAKSLLYNSIGSTRIVLWLSGSAIFLLSLGTCFTGYVLVAGQMSYWALIVILNLVSVIPVIDDLIISAMLSGSSPTTVALHRFLSLHFVMSMAATAAMALHVISVHRSRPGASLGLEDGSWALSDVLTKDSLMVSFIIGLTLFPGMRLLIHPDNWTSYLVLRTPPHIEPEIYFLWLFCILKTRSSKLVGVIFRCGSCR